VCVGAGGAPPGIPSSNRIQESESNFIIWATGGQHSDLTDVRVKLSLLGIIPALHLPMPSVPVWEPPSPGGAGVQDRLARLRGLQIDAEQLLPASVVCTPAPTLAASELGAGWGVGICAFICLRHPDVVLLYCLDLGGCVSPSPVLMSCVAVPWFVAVCTMITCWVSLRRDQKI
jgi:hypothetical protein